VVHLAGHSFLNPRLAVLAGHGLYYVTDSAELPWTHSLGDLARWVATRYPGADVGAVLEAMALTELAEARPQELSGGERKRAALALALIRRPEVLLADEPFAGIPPRDAEVIARALQGLSAGKGAVIVTGHEVQELFAIADEITWVTAGTSHGLGTPAESRRYEQFAREYLGGWSTGMARAGKPGEDR
jgi:ABC-type multidrug transport system ATPase subunit